MGKKKENKQEGKEKGKISQSKKDLVYFVVPGKYAREVLGTDNTIEARDKVREALVEKFGSAPESTRGHVSEEKAMKTLAEKWGIDVSELEELKAKGK